MGTLILSLLVVFVLVAVVTPNPVPDESPLFDSLDDNYDEFERMEEERENKDDAINRIENTRDVEKPRATEKESLPAVNQAVDSRQFATFPMNAVAPEMRAMSPQEMFLLQNRADPNQNPTVGGGPLNRQVFPVQYYYGQPPVWNQGVPLSSGGPVWYPGMQTVWN